MSNGDVNDKQSTMKGMYYLLIHHLYDLFFRNRKAELSIYAITLSITLTYAVISEMVLGKQKAAVLYEGCLLALTVLGTLISGYIFGAINSSHKQHRDVEVQSNSEEALLHMQRLLVNKRQVLFNPLSTRSVSDSSAEDVRRLVESSVEVQKETNSLLNQTAREINELGRYLSSQGITQLGKVIAKDNLQSLTLIAEEINKSLQAYLERLSEDLLQLQIGNVRSIILNELENQRIQPELIEPIGDLIQRERAQKYTAKREKTSSSAYFNLGLIYLRQGKFEEAEVEFSAAARIEPNNSLYHNCIGFALDKKGDYKQAETEFRKALWLDSRSSSYRNNLGFNLYNQGRFEEAEVEFREAIRHAANFSVYHRNLALVLEKLGKYDEAEAELREASKFSSPDSENKDIYSQPTIPRSRVEK